MDPVDNIEGWPLGIIEAVSNLWRRGVLVAIASKNDEDRARFFWNKLYGKIFPLENFASVKINWGSKVDSISEILREVNLLPSNVVFVDDNPVERQRVHDAFPEIRLLGGSVLEWRRALLWSAEVQLAGVTDEAVNRTSMIKGQIERGLQSSKMSQDEFDQSLQIKLAINEISDLSSKLFERAYELLNKTNQFNTTGRRWSKSELSEFLASGGAIITGSVSDRFAEYGLVVLVMIRNGLVDQFVMSCRVFGLGIEKAMMSFIATRYKVDPLRVKLGDTGKNSVARAFFAESGFINTGTSWELANPNRTLQPNFIEFI